MRDIRIRTDTANIQFSGSTGFAMNLHATKDGISFSSGSVKSMILSGSGKVLLYNDVFFKNYTGNKTGSLVTIAGFSSTGQFLQLPIGSVAIISGSIYTLQPKHIAFGAPGSYISSSKDLIWDGELRYLETSGSIKFNSTNGALRDKWGNWQVGIIASNSGSSNGEIRLGSLSSIPGYKVNTITFNTQDTNRMNISGSVISMQTTITTISGSSIYLNANNVTKNGVQLVDEYTAIAYSVVL